ncbi:MAG: cupin domain-containing protein, partial [Desulfuromonadales bacterium]|nr:cupin domain-containing protein [Desulfuromonadales bacterium]
MLKSTLALLCLLFTLAAPALALDSKAITVDVLAKSSASWDGNDLPHYPQGTPEITILHIKIPPGVKLPLHEHPVINAGVLLKGELTVTTENHQTIHIKAGDGL